jgi:hypothetical protein
MGLLTSSLIVDIFGQPWKWPVTFLTSKWHFLLPLTLWPLTLWPLTHWASNPLPYDLWPFKSPSVTFDITWPLSYTCNLSPLFTMICTITTSYGTFLAPHWGATDTNEPWSGCWLLLWYLTYLTLKVTIDLLDLRLTFQITIDQVTLF